MSAVVGEVRQPAPAENGMLCPRDIDELRQAVAEALAAKTPLLVEGTGSKRSLGQAPPRAPEARRLSMAACRGVTLYEPEELVLSGLAGTPMAEVQALLAAHRQRLDFEPIDYGPLHGLPRGLGTLGGTLACNLAGPRRIARGAARDHVLGIAAVSGRGEIFRSGGRVVKNVTGYDLSKGMAGSYGTLAVLSSVTVKVMPEAEAETTLVLRGLPDDAAAGAMAAAMGSPADVSGAAPRPYGVAARVANGALGREAATLVRLDGFGPSVEARAAHLGAALSRVAPLERLEGEASKSVWRDVRDAVPFADGTERPVWRLSVAPSKGHEIVMALRMAAAIDAFYDWQGGLVWLRLEASAPEAALVREAVRRAGGGHATLVRASEAERARTRVFEPQPAPLARLSQRLKHQFDPAGILNPGRMG